MFCFWGTPSLSIQISNCMPAMQLLVNTSATLRCLIGSKRTTGSEGGHMALYEGLGIGMLGKIEQSRDKRRYGGGFVDIFDPNYTVVI